VPKIPSAALGQGLLVDRVLGLPEKRYRVWGSKVKAPWFAAALIALVFSSHSFAADWFNTISALYAKGTMPQSAQVKAGQAWFGRCATSNWRTNRTDGALFIHVDKDPISGAVFRMIPLFAAHEVSDRSRAEAAVKRMIAQGVLPTGVHASAKDRAWYMNIDRADSIPKVFLRYTTGEQGEPLLVLKGTDARGVRTYCYYFAPLAEKATAVLN